MDLGMISLPIRPRIILSHAPRKATSPRVNVPGRLSRQPEINGIRTQLDIPAPGDASSFIYRYRLKECSILPGSEDSTSRKVREVNPTLHAIIIPWPKPISLPRPDLSGSYHRFASSVIPAIAFGIALSRGS